MYLCLCSITASGLWERGLAYLFIYLSNFKLLANWSNLLQSWLLLHFNWEPWGILQCFVGESKPTKTHCVLGYCFSFELKSFFGGWHSECTVNRSNKHFHTEPCLCLLHHNNSPLSYSRSFGVSCCFNGLMHWAGQKQLFIVSGQNTTYQESKSI